MRLVSLLALAVVACSAPAPPPPKRPIPVAPADAGVDAPPIADIVPQVELDRAEHVAFERAKPVFDRYCSACHTKRGKKTNQKRLDALDLTKYPFGGRYTKIVGGAIRDVLGQSGEPATMPFDRKGAVAGADLALVMAWVDAWARAHHDSTREPL